MRGRNLPRKLGTPQTRMLSTHRGFRVVSTKHANHDRADLQHTNLSQTLDMVYREDHRESSVGGQLRQGDTGISVHGVLLSKLVVFGTLKYPPPDVITCDMRASRVLRAPIATPSVSFYLDTGNRNHTAVESHRQGTKRVGVGYAKVR